MDSILTPFGLEEFDGKDPRDLAESDDPREQAAGVLIAASIRAAQILGIKEVPTGRN